MTMQKLASMIAKREGLKSQVKIGDVREILRVLIDLQVETLEKQFKERKKGIFLPYSSDPLFVLSLAAHEKFWDLYGGKKR